MIHYCYVCKQSITPDAQGMISREGVIEQSKGQNWYGVRSRFTTSALRPEDSIRRPRGLYPQGGEDQGLKRC